MASASARPLLRAGLLDGVSVVLAGAGSREQDLSRALGERIDKLGASVTTIVLELGEDVESNESKASADLTNGDVELGGLDAIVIDGGALFAASPDGLGLQLATAAIWNGARAFASLLIESGAPGRIILTAPAPGQGEHGAAAVSALENLARTLSIEWARYGITTVAIAPGSRTQPAETTELCAYLLSPAGAYFSGCLLDLRGVG